MKWNPINIKQDQLLTITVVVALLLFCSSIYTNQIFGHNFAGDQSASFLALMDQIQTKMSLINTNLVDNNQPLAKDHLNKLMNYIQNI